MGVTTAAAAGNTITVKVDLSAPYGVPYGMDQAASDLTLGLPVQEQDTICGYSWSAGRHDQPRRRFDIDSLPAPSSMITVAGVSAAGYNGTFPDFVREHGRSTRRRQLRHH